MIISPIYSFVDFQNRISTSLPSYQMGIAFQFLFGQDDDVSPDDHLSVGAQPADDDDATFLLSTSLISVVCYWGKMAGIDFTSSFPIVIGSGQIIPAATYSTLQDVLDALALVGFNTTTETTFLQCCTDNIQNYTIATDKGNITINFYVGLVYVDMETSANESDLQSNGILYNDCFKIVLFKEDEVLARSNKFKRVSDNRFLTKLNYYNNEDAFDFHYPSDSLVNKIWFPFYLRKPSPIVTRKIYIRSNKTYKVQFANIEKELEGTTDYFPEEIHDRFIVALEHDNKHVYSDGRYKIDDDIFMNSDYNIAWQSNDVYDAPLIAPATFKALKYFAGRNSNCEQRPVCIPLPTQGGGGGGGCVAVTIENVDLPDAVVGEPYSVDIALSGDGPFVISGESVIAWMTITLNVDHVELRGTPTEDDITTGLTVGFHITNCAGAEADDFSSTIDVNLPPADGDGQLNNNVDGFEVEDVSLAGHGVCTPYTNFPVVSGDSGTFSMPYEINGAITIRFNTEPLPSSITMEILINGTIMENDAHTTDPLSPVITSTNSYTLHVGDTIEINLS